jgi:hypothetical protein
MLARDPAPRLVIAGRSSQKAQLFSEALKHEFPGLSAQGIALDLNASNLAKSIAATDCDVVIHTAGPFQGQDYAVAKACIEAGAHYIDLADGRSFVTGFERLNDAAIRADVVAVTGASSFPGLSMAVAEDLARDVGPLHGIEISLAIAGRYPPGRATTEAILGYCGRPIPVLRQNKWEMCVGWLDLAWRRIPGLGWRLLGLCDVPDLELMSRRFQGIDDCIFRVSLESRLAQLGFAAMALMGRIGWVDDWRFLAPWIDRLARWSRPFGSDASAMTISAWGTGGRRTYVLNARSGDGPMIPCLPSVVLARKLARGEIDQRGALPCVGLYALNEIEAAFEGMDISARIA